MKKQVSSPPPDCWSPPGNRRLPRRCAGPFGPLHQRALPLSYGKVALAGGGRTRDHARGAKKRRSSPLGDLKALRGTFAPGSGSAYAGRLSGPARPSVEEVTGGFTTAALLRHRGERSAAEPGLAAHRDSNPPAGLHRQFSQTKKRPPSPPRCDACGKARRGTIKTCAARADRTPLWSDTPALSTGCGLFQPANEATDLFTTAGDVGPAGNRRMPLWSEDRATRACRPTARFERAASAFRAALYR